MDKLFNQARQKTIVFMFSLFISLARYIDLTPALAQFVGNVQPVLARLGGLAFAHSHGGAGAAVGQMHQPVFTPQAAEFLALAFL